MESAARRLIHQASVEEKDSVSHGAQGHKGCCGACENSGTCAKNQGGASSQSSIVAQSTEVFDREMLAQLSIEKLRVVGAKKESSMSSSSNHDPKATDSQPKLRLFDPETESRQTDLANQVSADITNDQQLANDSLRALEELESLTREAIEDEDEMRSHGWVERPTSKPPSLPALPQLDKSPFSVPLDIEVPGKGEKPSEAFMQELRDASEKLENATPIEILTWGLERYQDKFTFATAFGPEGMTILYFLSKIDPSVRVFNLDTGYQFKETLELRDQVQRKYGIDVQLFKPELSVEEYEAAHGGPVYRTDPNKCCFDRKISVLHRATEGMQAWASAIRRDQSPDRAKAPIVGWDAKFSLVKISPLANWTSNDVWRLIMDEQIPYNPLHDQGYTSIGCWPCTRSVGLGEDERAGRWSGTQKTECGLHSVD